MSFQIPKYLQDYLSTKSTSPSPFWVNMSQYYSGLSPYFINYMNTVVRQDLAYASGIKDGTTQNSISSNIGYAIKRTAVKLIKGERVIFNGDDMACEFLDNVWVKKSRFNKFLAQAIDYAESAGTAAIKLNVDARGWTNLTAHRVDRYYATVTDTGEVIDAIFMLTVLASQQAGNTATQYWLVEHRYMKQGVPFVVYKAHVKSGTAGADVLPTLDGDGIPYKDLSRTMQQVVNKMGIRLNKPMSLPFDKRDGLGVWILCRTETNSVVPGLYMGDPLLYAAEDILWSIDTVFAGSIIDVLNGTGKILVPKRFLREIRDVLAGNGINVTAAQERALGEEDDSDELVYISTERDKEFPPTSVQFDIRSTQYREILEVYMRQAVAHCGFSPSSVFPFLADNSARTATEVTAEENLTRATIRSAHQMYLPVIDEALEAVLRFEGFNGTASIQLSDDIGNKIQRDANLRANYEAGAIPQETFIQKINNLSLKETREYQSKIDKESDARQSQVFDGMGGDFV